MVSLLRVVRGIVATGRQGRCVVLYYHSVPLHQKTQFASQMDRLLRLAKPICADNGETLTPGFRYVAITFDDGYKSVVENALPVLEERQIPFTIFLVTDTLGKKPDWLDASEAAKSGALISEEQLRELPNLVTVGSHTMTHPVLPMLDDERARREILESRLKLQRILNRPVTLFSFPYGEFDSRILEWCRSAGYEKVFTIRPSSTTSYGQEFVIGRVSVDPTDWNLQFRLKVLGGYDWLLVASNLKRKLFASPFVSALIMPSKKLQSSGHANSS